MLCSLKRFQINENANYIVEMVMISKLKSKHYWKNKKEISERIKPRL